jgi:2-polyprenyl-3-methyl-5-hydroxy-6-metoxy-1,4-benzoquinol methylase
VVARTINHFVTALTKEQVFNQNPSRQKNQKPYICANANKQKHPPIVMGRMKQSNEWETRYQQGQTGWDRGDVSPNLLHWLETELLKPCRLLVPGCGNGHEVVTLAEQGFDVVAIDIAPTAIKNLRKTLKNRQLNAELIQTNFFTWESEKPFDAIYEQTSLCALHPDEWSRYEKCIYNWLKPNGKLFAHFMQTDQENGPPFHCDIHAMTDLFVAQRWQWSDQIETQFVHSENLYEKTFLLEKLRNDN